MDEGTEGQAVLETRGRSSNGEGEREGRGRGEEGERKGRGRGEGGEREGRGRGEGGEREGRGRGKGGVRVEDMGNRTVKMMKANERNKLRKICIKMGRGEEN